MPLSRRQFVGAVPAALCAQSAAPIDRRTLVQRHNPVLRDCDSRAPLSIGNGEFAFTADVTGLQSFPTLYEKQVPLCTMSQWGWHTAAGRPPGQLKLTPYETFGRPVGYPTDSRGQKELFDWLRENPHRLHLGRIGFAVDRIRPSARSWTSGRARCTASSLLKGSASVLRRPAIRRSTW